AAGYGDVHDAAVDDRNHLDHAGRQRLAPDLLEARNVAFVDLIERAETLRIVSSAIHQPVRRIRIAQHLVGDRKPPDLVGAARLARFAGLRRGRSRRERNHSAEQHLTATDSSHGSPSSLIFESRLPASSPNAVALPDYDTS